VKGPQPLAVNYFAHALPFLDGDPYFLAGTGVPDWLAVVDRKVRLRLKHAALFAADADPRVAAVARGAAQHVRDDAAFHRTRAFAELSWELTVAARDVLEGETGLKPAFLGHLLVEVLLDAELAAEQPQALQTYYRLLESVAAAEVQEAVNRMAPRPTARLAAMISLFRRERILWDYLEDGKLMKRLDQVMRRVQLGGLPEGFREILPEARRVVRRRQAELLDGIPTLADGKA
jgi:hypothetical protein